MSIISFIEKVCVQDVVYWGNPTPNGTGGYNFDAAEEIKCRWDEKKQLIIDNKGKEIISNAVVLIPQKYIVEEGGWLYLGTLDDSEVDSDADPMDIEGAHQIKKLSKTPLFKSSVNFVIEVYVR